MDVPAVLGRHRQIDRSTDSRTTLQAWEAHVAWRRLFKANFANILPKLKSSSTLHGYMRGCIQRDACTHVYSLHGGQCFTFRWHAEILMACGGSVVLCNLVASLQAGRASEIYVYTKACFSTSSDSHATRRALTTYTRLRTLQTEYLPCISVRKSAQSSQDAHH